MKTVLKWFGPYSTKEFLTASDRRIKFGRPGVYIWEETLPHGCRVSYVGKANDLWQRQLEHYWYQLGGAYFLPGSYRACGEDWSLDLSSQIVRDTLFDLAKFTKLVSENFDYVNQTSVNGDLRRKLNAPTTRSILGD